MNLLEWLSDIFSTPSEQARLVTVLISAVLAVSLLLLNQWFSQRKSRKELLIQKLEHMASTLYSFQKTAHTLVESFFLQQTPNDEAISELITLRNEAEMLAKLYFKEANIDLAIASDIITIGYEYMDEEHLKTGEIIPENHPFTLFTDELEKLRESIESELSILIAKHI